ncbi:KEOPS complex subunit Pcc1 [Natrinema salifodinae]|uniref:KEOPS complex subunit Pcc1 n=1 Tax=Natrinema salifodinae TaxID=1202768 RepID=A0A1I0NJQ3_9EURY|nr:KEOPS complex subunit Pcc1 [Natrinema salifodinae]SEW01090.1 hypothetical protein SAMN05216285_1759 [Natrinema salifodinae]
MSRKATIRTDCDDPVLVARALSPDNTAEMTTTVERETPEVADTEDGADDGAGTVVTRIERETTSGLRSTVDDYVVNLEVAIDVATNARTARHPTDTGSVSDTDSDTAHDTQ